MAASDPRVMLTKVLSTLTRREEKMIRLRDGLGDGTRRTYEEIATIFQISSDEARELEARSRRKLRLHISKLKDESRDKVLELIEPPTVDTQQIELINRAVASFNELTPELIDHVRRNNEDINDLSWGVVEHLVAELLAQQGFEDVRLVGRSAETGADIYACKTIAGVGTRVRYYVEVKHVKGSIGIDTVRILLGALTDERAEFGWNGAILVTSGRIADFRRGTRENWEYKGVALRDREDLFAWLRDYQPASGGLWLPKPESGMPPTCGTDGTR